MKPRCVVVIGAGLIGTSVALALTARGVEVLLADRNPEMVRLASELDAGSALPAAPRAPADLAVLAVPPAAVLAALLDAQERGLAARVGARAGPGAARPRLVGSRRAQAACRRAAAHDRSERTDPLTGTCGRSAAAGRDVSFERVLESAQGVVEHQAPPDGQLRARGSTRSPRRAGPQGPATTR